MQSLIRLKEGHSNSGLQARLFNSKVYKEKIVKARTQLQVSNGNSVPAILLRLQGEIIGSRYLKEI